jgi:hypothetical protein
MSLKMLYGETTLSITINTSTYETNTGFDISTNIGLAFMLKSNPLEEDLSAEYSITEGANLSFASNVITAKINDWSSLVVNEAYSIGVGFKLPGDSLYREIPLATGEDKITFFQDVIRG